MRFLSIQIVIFLTLSVISCSQGERERNVTIIVTGRNGAGIKETIGTLLGETMNSTNDVAKNALIDITEYTISDITSESGHTYKLRIVETPGLVDCRTLEEDAQILAALKSYITYAGPPGPEFFLVLSKFTEDSVIEKSSPFAQVLKRMDIFKTAFLDKALPQKIPFTFLLTGLMKDTKLNQRRPTRKLASFQRAVLKNTGPDFASLVSFVVGDNDAFEHGAEVKDGFYELTNKELYPKNVWQTMINTFRK